MRVVGAPGPGPSPVIMPNYMLIALGEIGVVEDTRPGKSNARIEQYHSVTRAGRAVDDVPWCASYVGWCLEMAGIASTRNKGAASYLTYGLPCLDLSPGADGSWYYPVGAIVVFDKSDPDSKGTGHVAFSLGRSGKEIFVVGGNQGNRVSIATRKVSTVAGVRLPHPVQLPRRSSIPPALVG